MVQPSRLAASCKGCSWFLTVWPRSLVLTLTYRAARLVEAERSDDVAMPDRLARFLSPSSNGCQSVSRCQCLDNHSTTADNPVDKIGGEQICHAAQRSLKPYGHMLVALGF
jgi:hypothetical protein